MLTTEQSLYRQSKLGGSDIPLLLGISKYGNRLTLFNQKTGKAPQASLDNDFTDWGNLLEPTIINHFCQKNTAKVKTVDTLTHPEYPDFIGNLDSLIVANTGEYIAYDGKRKDWGYYYEQVLEIKTAHFMKERVWGDINSGESEKIPNEYYVQVQWYMFVSNAQSAKVCVLIGGNDYREYLIARNDTFIDMVLLIAKEFWYENVQKGIAPSPLNLDEHKQAFPSTAGEMVAESALQDRVHEYRKIKAKIDDLQEQLEKIKTNIVLAMGENELLVSETGEKLASNKTVKGKISIDSKQLKAEYLDIYQKCSKQGKDYHVFRC